MAIQKYLVNNTWNILSKNTIKLYKVRKYQKLSSSFVL